MTDLLNIFMVNVVGYDFSLFPVMVSYQRTLRRGAIYILVTSVNLDIARIKVRKKTKANSWRPSYLSGGLPSTDIQPTIKKVS
jgi:hypothetical protein